MKLSKKHIKNIIFEFIIISVGAAIAAAAIFFFMIPSHVVVGSGSALAMVLGNFIDIPISVIMFIINAVLLTLGFLLIGPEFGIKTVYSAIMVPAYMGLFELLLPDFQSLTNDSLLDMIGYILVVGIGSAILFSRNASSGGLDIVAKIMNRYLKMELGRAMSLSGIAVALTSAFVYDTKTVVLSVIGTYFCGMMLDYFIFGMGLKRRVCIISSKHDEFVRYIVHELHSGATIYESYGAYDNTPRKEIVTIVDKSEYRRLMEFIRKNDPKAFITVYSVNEMQYQKKIKE
ncbi:MAG: YitT family protein [Clostridia bacterium]|nr:YitT family protein [Clostridia bacterium]